VCESKCLTHDVVCADVSPTPVFGECKKTCDLAAMFVNHQPKRRRYDKRTSSANWGDDGYVLYAAHVLYAVRLYAQGFLSAAVVESNVELFVARRDASFMAEQRFEQQVKANIAMQNSGL